MNSEYSKKLSYLKIMMLARKELLKNPISGLTHSFGSLAYAYGYTGLGKALHASTFGIEFTLPNELKK